MLRGERKVASFKCAPLFNAKNGPQDKRSEDTLGKIKDFAAIIQASITTAALIAGGIWFIVTGDYRTKLNINSSITHRIIDKEHIWLRLYVTMENVGKRRIYLGYCYIQVQQILPLDISIQDKIHDAQNSNDSNSISKNGHIDWPAIDGNEFNGYINEQIEPGEKHYAEYNFILPSNIRTVRIFSSISREIHDSSIRVSSEIYEIKNNEQEENTRKSLNSNSID